MNNIFIAFSILISAFSFINAMDSNNNKKQELINQNNGTLKNKHINDLMFKLAEKGHMQPMLFYVYNSFKQEKYSEALKWIGRYNLRVWQDANCIDSKSETCELPLIYGHQWKKMLEEIDKNVPNNQADQIRREVIDWCQKLLSNNLLPAPMVLLQDNDQLIDSREWLQKRQEPINVMIQEMDAKNK